MILAEVKMEKPDCINIYTKHKSQNVIDMDIEV